MKDERLYLVHTLDCISWVRRYTEDGEEAFYTDRKTQDAVLRNLQVLAQSCMRLPASLRERRAEVDWRGLAGFRNIVVHDYLRIDLEEVWVIIRDDLSPLATVMAEELVRVDAEIREQDEEGST